MRVGDMPHFADLGLLSVPRRRRKSKIAGAAVAAGHQRVQRLPSEDAGRHVRHPLPAAQPRRPLAPRGAASDVTAPLAHGPTVL